MSLPAFDQDWVDASVARTIRLWHSCSTGPRQRVPRYKPGEQARREQAYDEALQTVEAESGSAVESFGRFAARALDLEGDAIDLLTRDFLPIGTGLARRARQFDPGLSTDEVIQAARNAWTACGLQPLLGEAVTLTPSIFGYSMIYPYSDNYLDDANIDDQAKSRFSRRFRCRLSGEPLPATNHRERALWKLIALIETQYPRTEFPRVFESLLAIHRAQEHSVQQLSTDGLDRFAEVLRLSCAKGGTSVLADACLVRGSLSKAESRFAFEWGVLLQLGDDLQDLRDDMRRGSNTVFSLTVASGKPLDEPALQLLRLSEKVGKRMDKLPSGTATLKELLKMSWRSLIIRAIAESHEFFSPGLLAEAEKFSPFRFDFLRRRSERLASRHGLYAAMFERLLENHGQSCRSETIGSILDAR